MVSSFSQSCSNAHSTTHSAAHSAATHQKAAQQKATRHPDKSTFIGVDALAHLPGSVALPPVYPDEPFISQKHEVNPALALNLLSDIQSVIVNWQEQLRQLVSAMNALEAQGPMVEGWLECSAEQKPIGGNTAYGTQMTGAEKTLLRHGDTDALMQYVNSLDTHSQQQSPARGPEEYPAEYSAERSTDLSAQYRLCSLDANGQVKSKPCPAEQMGMVSLAIARHQKFKQLLSQKQAIEAKLQKAVDQLTGVRGTLHHID